MSKTIHSLRWFVSICVVFIIFVLSGYHFVKPYLKFKFSPLEVTRVNAMTMYRKVIPGGPARFLSQDGDYVVGIGQVSSLDTDWALYLYDTQGTFSDSSDDTYSTIDTANEGELGRAIIDGDYVTWLVDSETSNIFILKSYQISTQDTFIISHTVHGEDYSRDGDKVVFAYDVGNSNYLKYYNLSTRSGSDICTASGKHFFPNINGNVIVWQDTRNDQNTRSDIYMYNLSTNQESVVANSSDFERLPLTNGVVVIYTVVKSNSRQIRMYNVQNSTDLLVESYSKDDAVFLWDINSTHAVYGLKDAVNNNNHVQLIRLSDMAKTTVETSNFDIRKVLLGSTQLIYCIVNSDDYYDMGIVKGYDITNTSSYTIRNQGSTYWEININKSTNHAIVSSVGSSNDSSEWDISLFSLPFFMK
jgi:beta propeller repeat protein